MTSYYDNDFDINDFKNLFETQLQSIEVVTNESEGNPIVDSPALKWNSFFETHNGGSFFKPRNYIIHEFQSYFELASTACSEKNVTFVILEVGSGYGCTLIPLIEYYYHNESLIHPYFVATDYSEIALSILCNNDVYKNAYFKNIIKTALWDATLPLPSTLQDYSNSASIVLCVFALSAVYPELHCNCLYNISTTMSAGSYLLFRDYAHLDMTMLRHKQRLGSSLFRRPDGTLCYYFTLEYLQALMHTTVSVPSQTSSSTCCSIPLSDIFEIVEMKYACVKNVNRKKSIEMRRVFVHAVFRKIG